MRRIVLILLCICSSIGVFAQSQDSISVPEKGWVTLRIHPARFLYGLNGGIDFRVGRNTIIGGTYQNHNRDFITPIRTLELDLREADGHFAEVHMYFETNNVVFHGPRLGAKLISFPRSTYGDADDVEGVYELARDQQNLYATYSLGYRRVDRGFFVSANVTAGFVWFQAKDFYQLGGSDNIEVVSANQVYPHVLLELGVGWTI
ncbi:MAG: hypothetical protein HWD92_10195 [Flavobacteriia bacterium]|nr:hypothetical protein [Flavobacteriia bacterium]